jgi:DNA-3-methyladenine glycosylase
MREVYRAAAVGRGGAWGAPAGGGCHPAAQASGSWQDRPVDTDWRALPALSPSFYRRPAEEVAPELLGKLLVHELGEEVLVLRIVETEAYLGAPDRASHAWAGRHTARNHSLYLVGGHAYVYFIYGMHFCLNAVTGDEGVGAAVLLRAGEPVAGETGMRQRRGLALAGAVAPGQVAGGPGRLCRALGVDRAADGLALTSGRLRIVADPEGAAPSEVAVGPRIGVAYAGEAAGWPLRFAVRGHRHVSRPWPPGAGGGGVRRGAARGSRGAT